MRTIITFLVLFVAAASHAQSLGAFKERLSAPASSMSGAGARITVAEHGDAAGAVERASRTTVRSRVRGYRVCIFFDNGAGARAGALSAKTLFEETFPETKAYWVYDVPYFKVSVGNCLTAEEAIVLKGRVSSVFPKAFLKSEEFAVSDLLE